MEGIDGNYVELAKEASTGCLTETHLAYQLRRAWGKVILYHLVSSFGISRLFCKLSWELERELALTANDSIIYSSQMT